ncbi:MAG: DUF302 domain-containing protein [Campylobacterales bacterium]|nr:DUF302 domain-containing protein [Campylobacterales bacterium]
MKKFLLLGLMVLAFLGCENKKGAFLNTVESQNDMTTTIQKFIAALPGEELNYLVSINHAKNANDLNITLKPEVLVVFGNTKVEAMLMQCNPTMGLDLPLNMLFTTDYEGKTSMTYTNPEYWSLKHNIKDTKCLDIINKINVSLQTLAKEAAAK